MDHSIPPETQRVNTFEDFEELLIKGHENFVIAFVRADGRKMTEAAPFDPEDPMSYALVRLIVNDPRVRLYRAAKDI